MGFGELMATGPQKNQYFWFNSIHFKSANIILKKMNVSEMSNELIK